MTDRKDGGPVYPIFSRGGDYDDYADWGGMSMRTYFASHAPEIDRFFEEPNDKYLIRVVEWNFKYADAMIARLREDVAKFRDDAP